VALGTSKSHLRYLPSSTEAGEHRLRLLKAMDRLAANADFQALRKHEDETLELLDVLSRLERDEIAGRWMQGLRQFLGEKQKIFKHLKAEIDAAAKNENSKRGPGGPRIRTP
jgi:hypothetical protein